MLHRARIQRRPISMPQARPPVQPEVTRGPVTPYDYAATFCVKGIPGNIVQDVINIGVDGAFVATAIGYGFEEERGRAVEPRGLGEPFTPGNITLGQIPPATLLSGFRINPEASFQQMVFDVNGPPGSLNQNFTFTNRPLPQSLGLRIVDAKGPDRNRKSLFQQVKAPEEMSFLFSIVDTGTGRELQDEPTHNLASLGKSNGERPFRVLPKPLSFHPRSTIRLQVIERTEGIEGTLFIVLFGYKLLGAMGCPEPVARALSGIPHCPTETFGLPSDRIIPFDYVATVPLMGKPGNIVEDEVNINIDGGFIATHVGYGLEVEHQAVELQNASEEGFLEGTLRNQTNQPIANTDFELSRGSQVSNHTTDAKGHFNLPLLPGEYQIRYGKSESRKLRVFSLITTTVAIQTPASGTALLVDRATTNLAKVPLKLFRPEALLYGFRVRPELVRLVFQNGGALTSQLDIELVDRIFQPLNQPEAVSFRYSLFDTGTGRELQNQPIHNIAGLGIANGDRPFKAFARPLVMLPRSSIKVTVEERFGRGQLFLVFQGYKLIGNSPVRS